MKKWLHGGVGAVTIILNNLDLFRTSASKMVQLLGKSVN
jgi:hypothetical protein